MDEIEIKQIHLPFTYREQVQMIIFKSGRLSASKLAIMYEKNELDPCFLHMLHALKRFTIMNAKQLEQLFYLEDMPFDHKRLSSKSAQNTYRNEITHLVKYGILDQYQFVNGNTKIAPNLYAPGSAVYQQNHIRPIVPLENLPHGVSTNRAANATEIFYEEALSVLALNQLHLRILSENTLPQTAYREWLTSKTPANIYRFKDNTFAVAIAPRTDSRGRKSRDIMFDAFKALQGENTAWDDKFLMSVVESPEYALSVHQNVPEEIRCRTKYITDHETFYGKGALQLIQITGANSFTITEKTL